MNALDFLYDGQQLSDFGFMIGTIDSGDISSILTDESQITFNTVALDHGRKNYLASFQYDSSITSNFTIIKNPCVSSSLEISDDEYRAIMRWLNRGKFLKFEFIDSDKDYAACHYYASFNIVKNRVAGKVLGLDLSMTTNSPFAYGGEYISTFTATDTVTGFEIEDISDEIGTTYPNMEIIVAEAGDLTIYNQTNGVEMVIKNCEANETIAIFGPEHIIQTNSTTHDLSRNFNFDFFALTNTYANRTNRFSVSLPCTLTISYEPIIKSGF